MKASALLRGMTFTMACVVGVACSNKPKADARSAANDPYAPAIVRGAPIILPGDTLKPDTAAKHAAAADEVRRELNTDYSVLGAAIVFGDPNMIGASYAADARLVTPDSTVTGVAAIARTLSKLGPAKSLREFQRRSLATRVVDSTVTDSGTFIVFTKRAGADSILERGHYATMWRMHAPPFHWLITRDRLYPDPAQKKSR